MGDKEGNLIFWKNAGLKKFDKFDEKKTQVLSKNSLEIKVTINNKDKVDTRLIPGEDQIKYIGFTLSKIKDNGIEKNK